MKKPNKEQMEKDFELIPSVNVEGESEDRGNLGIGEVPKGEVQREETPKEVLTRGYVGSFTGGRIYVVHVATGQGFFSTPRSKAWDNQKVFQKHVSFDTLDEKHYNRAVRILTEERQSTGCRTC